MKITKYCMLIFLATAGMALAEPTTKKPDVSTVFFHGKKLYQVAAVSGVPSAEREEILVRRLTRLAKSPLFRNDAMEIRNDEALGASMVFSGDDFVCSVWDEEAKVLGRSRKELADEHMAIIREAIDDYRKDYTSTSYIQGAVFSAIATGIFVLLLIIISVLKKREETWVARWLTGKKLFKLIDGEGLLAFNHLFVRLIQGGLIFFLFVIYLNYVLSLFPGTYDFSAMMFGFVSTPLKLFFQQFVESIPDLFALAVIVTLSGFILKGIRNIFKQIGAGTIRISGFYSDWADPTFNLVRLLVIILTIVSAWPYIPGSDSPAFKGISIFVGVLFSLGSTSVVGNIFSGLVLTYMRPFSNGDYIQINEIKGTLLDRRTFSTRIQTLKNERITIPNSAVAGNPIINYSRRAKQEGVLLYIAITIGYDVPWRTVHELMLAAAADTADVLKTPEPFVLQSALEDFYVRYELNVATHTPERWPRIHSELHQNIQDRFIQSGVEIMSPHYRHNRTGNETTVPQRTEEQIHLGPNPA